MKSTASAHWSGGLKDGSGTISTKTGALRDVPYNFAQRFEGAEGSNPEELIGAAHSACFSMALAGQLGAAGMTAEAIDTTATVTLEKVDGDFSVTKVHLDLTAKIPGADEAKFREAAEGAKAGCPISRLLKAEVTLDAKLAS